MSGGVSVRDFPPPPMRLRAGGTHLTGTHFCFACVFVEQEMANRFSLRRHVRTQHADMWDDLFPVKCEQCGKRFKCAHQMAK